MDNKNNKDAFGSLSIGVGDKYLKRHQEALRIERATEFDKRIADFDAQTHNVEWANKVPDFCDREEENGKDIADISKYYKELKRIRKEASDVLKAEKVRLASEQKARKEAIRRAKIDDFDLQIMEFESKPHTVEWANKAGAFCSKMEAQGKSFSEESVRYNLLAGIRQEAEEIIRNEEMRIKAENEALELKKRELEIKRKAEEDQTVAKIEETINYLSSGKRDSAWVETVDNTSLLLKGLAQNVYDRISNRFIFDSIKNEAKIVHSALGLDVKIESLKRDKLKDEAWAKKVLKIESSFDSEFYQYMHHKNDYDEMYEKAVNLLYGVEILKLTEYIEKAENGDINDVLPTFDMIKNFEAKLKKAITIEDYITNFNTRWAEVVKLSNNEIAEKARQEKIREAKEKSAREERAAKARKRTRRIDRTKTALKITGIVLLCLLGVALVGGAVWYSVVNISKPVGKWIISGLSVAVAFALYLFIRGGRVRYFLSRFYLFAGVLLNIISIFVPVLGLYCTPVLALPIMTSITGMINYYKFKGKLSFRSIHSIILPIATLAVVLSTVCGVLVPIIFAVAFVVLAITASILKWCDVDGKWFSVGVTSILYALALSLFFVKFGKMPLILSLSTAGLFIYFWILSSKVYDVSSTVKASILMVINIIAIILNVVATFFPQAKLYCLPLLGATVVVSIIETIFANSSYESDAVVTMDILNILFALYGFGFVLYRLIGGMGGAWAFAGIIVLVGIIHAVIHAVTDADISGTPFYIISVIMIFAVAILPWFNNGQLYAICLGMGISSPIINFEVGSTDDYDTSAFGWAFFGYIIDAIVLIITAIITFG